MVELPATAVIVPPVQSVLTFGKSATVIPAGRLSVKSKEVTGVPEALLSIVKVSVVTLPAPIVV